MMTRGIGSIPMAMRTGNLMKTVACTRFARINDLPIKESNPKYHWPLGRRPEGHVGLSDLGL